MIDAVLKTLHVVAIIIWVGGMIFAHFFLRPAIGRLDPPVRLTLMHDVLGRFFATVLVVATLALVTGIWMLERVASLVEQTGGSFGMPWSWTLMAVFGTLMVAIFMHIRFALYKRMSVAVSNADWPAAGGAMAQIRLWVGVNLVLGVAIVAITLLFGPG